MFQTHKRIAVFLFSFISLISVVHGQESLIPYRVKDKWGYADLDGKIKIAPRFDYARFFYAGYAEVYSTGKFGLVNRKGITIVPVAYSDIQIVGRFDIKTNITTLTHAIVGATGYKHGLYELPSGKLLIDTVYEEISDAWHGFFLVGNGHGKRGIYSARSKTWIAKPVYPYVQVISDTLVVVGDANGYSAIPVYTKGAGKARPYELETVPLREARISTAQETVVAPAEPKKPEPSPEERYKSQLLMKDGKYGFAFVHAPYIGDTIPPLYDSLDRRSENIGRLAVKKDGKWGLINSKNQVILAMEYEGVDAYNSLPEDNIFAVQQNGRCSIIHKASGKILAQGYDEVRRGAYFYLLRKNDLWGILFLKNINSPVLIEPEFVKVDTRTDNFKLRDGQEIFVLSVQLDNTGNRSGYISSKGKKYYTD